MRTPPPTPPTQSLVNLAELKPEPLHARSQKNQALGNYLVTLIYFGSLTLTYQNLQNSRVPINSILGFIIGTYKKVWYSKAQL